MIDYKSIYDTLYAQGYHADKNYTHAARLCEWLDENASFDSILDMGCSHGWVMRKYKNKKRAAGIDVSGRAVKMCEEDGLEVYQGNMAYSSEIISLMSGKDEQFDVVISTDAFEHLTLDHALFAVKDACRLARKYICMRIATGPDVADWKDKVDQVEQLHLTCQPTDWWLKQFRDVLHEMKIKNRTVLLDGNMFIIEKIGEADE